MSTQSADDNYPLYDTLAYANRLKEAGCDAKLAEIQAHEQVRVIQL